MTGVTVTVTSEDMADLFDAIANNSGVFSKGRALFLEWICPYITEDVKLRVDEANTHGGYRLTPLRSFCVYYAYFDAFDHKPFVHFTYEWGETQADTASAFVERLKDQYEGLRLATPEEYEEYRKQF